MKLHILLLTLFSISSFLAKKAILDGRRVVRWLQKDHPSQVWSIVAQCFQRRIYTSNSKNWIDEWMTYVMGSKNIT